MISAIFVLAFYHLNKSSCNYFEANITFSAVFAKVKKNPVLYNMADALRERMYEVGHGTILYRVQHALCFTDGLHSVDSQLDSMWDLCIV